eukprot:GHVS01074570.1.p1 GENE.GHVS01074570.1~~GHVS01074570.1.p1  ORF type:complete len:516 (+),score=107.04 GHVS01074570.1:230-1777(+)
MEQVASTIQQRRARRSVSFSEGRPVIHRGYSRSLKSSFFPNSLSSLAVASVCALSSMVVLYALFAAGAPNMASLLRVEAVAGGGSLGAVPHITELSQALRGVDSHVDDEMNTEGRAEDIFDQSLELTSGEGVPMFGTTSQSLRGVVESVRSVADGSALLEDDDSSLGRRRYDGVLLPGMTDAVDQIEEMAEDIQMEAREMKKTIQMLLRGGTKNRAFESKVEESVIADASPITTSISLSGLRKHMRGEADAVLETRNPLKPTGRVRGGVPAAADAVEKLLGDGHGNAVADVIEKRLAEAIKGEAERVGGGATGNVVRGSGGQLASTVVQEIREGAGGGKTLRGIKTLRRGGETVAGGVRQVDAGILRGEAVVEAVVGVIEELKEQGDENLTANVMAGVGGVVAASANKLRGTAGQEEDVAVMDGVVEVINEEVRKFGRLRGGGNENIVAANNVRRVSVLRSDGDEVTVEEGTAGRLRRSVESRMSGGEEQQIEQSLKATADSRRRNRENRLRTVS